MTLEYDIAVSQEAFATASENMRELEKRTMELHNKVSTMYNDLLSALNTPAGKELHLEAKFTVLKPITDLQAVISEISGVLSKIEKEEKYYKNVFVEYKELNKNINNF